MLHLDGADLLDLPAHERDAALVRLVPERHRVPRLLTDDAEAAAGFLADALAAGHEGVVVKGLDAPYAAGRRGSAWVKVKPVHTLDLVVLAVERGSGRRRGWLSNIHLGARDPGSGGFVMLGKTFKGMTDEMLAWQTERFTELATSAADESAYVVHVRPGAGRRDRLRRRPAVLPLPRRRRPALRPGRALPRRQDPGRGRHRGHGPLVPPVNRRVPSLRADRS